MPSLSHFTASRQPRWAELEDAAGAQRRQRPAPLSAADDIEASVAAIARSCQTWRSPSATFPTISSRSGSTGSRRARTCGCIARRRRPGDGSGSSSGRTLRGAFARRGGYLLASALLLFVPALAGVYRGAAGPDAARGAGARADAAGHGERPHVDGHRAGDCGPAWPRSSSPTTSRSRFSPSLAACCSGSAPSTCWSPTGYCWAACSGRRSSTASRRCCGRSSRRTATWS